jgi:hypothetical protein
LGVSQTDRDLHKLFILPKLQFSISRGGIIMLCGISVRIYEIAHIGCRIGLGT